MNMSDIAVTKHTSQTPAEVERAQETPLFTPRVDIRETETDVVLVADMPGVDESSVSIDLEGSELSIRGTFMPAAPEGYALSYQEYASGDYERSFTLGDTIDRDGENVLTIVVTSTKGPGGIYGAVKLLTGEPKKTP